MRTLARMGYTLAGLALLAPSAANAGMPISGGTPWVAGQKPSKPGLFKSAAAKPGQKQAGVRLCAECERVRVMAAEGVSIPPPPPLPPGTVVRGEICTQCGRPAAVLAGRLPGRSLPTFGGAEPGRAVVGDAPMFAGNGVDPVPIGAVQPRLASAIPTGPSNTRDASVMPTSMASDPVAPLGHNRPKVLSHLLGLSALGRDRSEANTRRKDEKHAMIPYGPQGAPAVTDVPASMVYGR
jgi:hypothetical protein